MAFSLSGELRPGGVRTTYKNGAMVIEETYFQRVITDDPLATRDEVLGTSGLPAMKSVSPAGLGILVAFDAKRDPQKVTWWECEFTYTSDPGNDNSGADGSLSSDPTEWIPIYETILEPYEDTSILDLDDNPYVNGAGIPLTPATVPKDVIRWDFFQFEATTVTDEDIADRHNSINSTEFKGRDPATLLLKVRSSVEGYYFGYPCRRTEYSLLWKKDNWHEKYPNVGDSFFYQPDGDSEGRHYPYRYKRTPEFTITGPLGIKNYLVNGPDSSPDDLFDGRSHLPTANGEADAHDCVEEGDYEGRKTYFVKPTPPDAPGYPIYYIEHRRFEWSEFSDYLRLPS